MMMMMIYESSKRHILEYFKLQILESSEKQTLESPLSIYLRNLLCSRFQKLHHMQTQGNSHGLDCRSSWRLLRTLYKILLKQIIELQGAFSMSFIFIPFHPISNSIQFLVPSNSQHFFLHSKSAVSLRKSSIFPTFFRKTPIILT